METRLPHWADCERFDRIDTDQDLKRPKHCRSGQHPKIALLGCCHIQSIPPAETPHHAIALPNNRHRYCLQLQPPPRVRYFIRSSLYGIICHARHAPPYPTLRLGKRVCGLDYERRLPPEGNWAIAYLWRCCAPPCGHLSFFKRLLLFLLMDGYLSPYNAFEDIVFPYDMDSSLSFFDLSTDIIDQVVKTE